MKSTNTLTQNNIIFDYEKGYTNKEISEKYNLHRTTILRILIRNNIILRKQNETARKHTLINEKYFNDIDTEEKAYILGLLYADGYINNNGFGITLMENDKNLLDIISIIVYGEIILGYRKSRNNCKPQYRLDVVSHTMKNDLIKHGCVKAKTFKIRFPQFDDIEMYRHFIRGYFDGDGCLCIPSKHPKNVTITIVSNIYFCDELAKYVRNIVGVNMKSLVRYGNVGTIRLTGGKQVLKFTNWLYENSTIFMKRKYDKYNNFINNTK